MSETNLPYINLSLYCRRFMKHVLFVTVTFLMQAPGILAQQAEEFNGPFAGWANIKTRFNAKGNGKDDDTKAIQRALDSLTQPLVSFNTGKNAYMVIYLPAGVYNISATLNLKGKIGVSFIGESPLTTIIKWTGPDNAAMLLANGTAYFKISRFTWDANNRKNIEAIGIHWKAREKDAKSESSAPTSIEISDNVFTGKCKLGISGGTLPGEGMSAMDSEVSIRRCSFNECETGIQISGYNSLDYWVWDCRFIKCSIGINCNSGNYHVYRSYFNGSSSSDVMNTNSYYTSVRGCYSENSAHFSYDQGASSNPFKRIFQGNTIMAPKLMPIVSYHLGKITVLDNTFDVAKDTSVHSSIETGSWAYGSIEVLSLNNIYRNKLPVKFVSSTLHKVYGIKDKYGTLVKSSSAALFAASQDKMPAKVSRTVITVPAGANAKKIQELINQAISLKTPKTVVYFPTGNYVLNEPLVIAENASIQLIGDGQINASVLLPSASFPKGKAMITVKGPTNIVIRDLMLSRFSNTASGINGVEFINTDQPNSSAFIDQLYTNSHQSLHIKDLDYLYVQESNSFFSDGKRITGGALVQKGGGTARLYCFGGQWAGLSADKNAVAVAKDCWWEGAMRKPLNFSGTGRITVDGAMVAPARADSNTTISISKFAGKISLLNMYVQGGVFIEPDNPNLNVLLWNMHFYHTLLPLKFITPAASYRGGFMGLTSQCFIANDKKCESVNTLPDAFKGNVKTDTFFPEMLADDRAAMPQLYTTGKPGASSIFISRVSAGDCNTAISFTK